MRGLVKSRYYVNYAIYNPRYEILGRGRRSANRFVRSWPRPIQLPNASATDADR